MIAKMIALDWRAMKYYQIRLLLLPVFVLAVDSNSHERIPVIKFLIKSFRS